MARATEKTDTERLGTSQAGTYLVGLPAGVETLSRPPPAAPEV
jgi:hypothetical protein